MFSRRLWVLCRPLFLRDLFRGGLPAPSPPLPVFLSWVGRVHSTLGGFRSWCFFVDSSSSGVLPFASSSVSVFCWVWFFLGSEGGSGSCFIASLVCGLLWRLLRSCRWSGRPWACYLCALGTVRHFLPSGMFASACFCLALQLFRYFFSFSSAGSFLLHPSRLWGLFLVPPVCLFDAVVARVVPRSFLLAFL